MEQIEHYEGIAGNSKNHHWVPEFYLKNFSIPYDEGFVYFYSKNGQPIRTNVGNIAAKNNLYTFRLEAGGSSKAMEGIFSEHEGRVAPIIDEILQNETLPKDEESRSELAVFVSMLKVRGPSFSDWLRNMEVEHIKLIQQIQAQHPESLKKHFADAGIQFADEEEFEETRKFMLDPSNYSVEMKNGEEYYFKQAMDLSKDIYNILMSEKSWHLFIAGGKRHFITSDNPVVIQELEGCPKHLSGGVLNGTVLLPLSPKACLAFRRIPLKEAKLVFGREDVMNINRSIVNAARRQIYSHLSSKDILTLCNQHLVGDESRVTLKRLAKFAPYYISQGIAQHQETQALKDNSLNSV